MEHLHFNDRNLCFYAVLNDFEHESKKEQEKITIKHFYFDELESLFSFIA